MLKKVRVAILISGRGSNMEKLHLATKAPEYPAEIVVVGSNNPDAEGLKYAQKNNLANFAIDHKKYLNSQNPLQARLDFDNAVIQELTKYNIDLICLAGFMRILTKDFIDKFRGRIINIHPSLLPKFKGANAVKDALISQEKITGCTTHFVIPELDSGSIILQSKVAIEKDDDYFSLLNKIHQEEYKIYPKTLKIIAEKILNHEI
jgi:phosphoribosylglycinamide formyltransferase-1